MKKKTLRELNFKVNKKKQKNKDIEVDHDIFEKVIEMCKKVDSPNDNLVRAFYFAKKKGFI